MIEGAVNAAHQAVISLPLRGPSGRTGHVDALVDTGFSFYLTLRPELVRELGLPREGFSHVSLADGSQVSLDVHAVTVLWEGQPRHVFAYAADAIPLAGMALLEHHRLCLDVEDGGRVVIEAKG